MRIVAIVVGTWLVLSVVATVAYVAFRGLLARTPVEALTPERSPTTAGPVVVRRREHERSGPAARLGPHPVRH